MRVTARFALCLMIGLIVVPGALAGKPRAQKASIGGVYESFTVGRGSGDLEGMRVVIVAAGGAYHAIVQIAAGGAEDPQPEFVPVTVKGMNVEFSAGGQQFTGTITAAGLRLKGGRFLKRQSCASYFQSKP